MVLSMEAHGQGEEHGRLLYEAHCIECHESQVHVREHKKASSLDDIRGYVSRWSTYKGLNWSGDEIESVVRYLNRQYYGYEAPTEGL